MLPVRVLFDHFCLPEWAKPLASSSNVRVGAEEMTSLPSWLGMGNMDKKSFTIFGIAILCNLCCFENFAFDRGLLHVRVIITKPFTKNLTEIKKEKYLLWSNGIWLYKVCNCSFRLQQNILMEYLLIIISILQLFLRSDLQSHFLTPEVETWGVSLCASLWLLMVWPEPA